MPAQVIDLSALPASDGFLVSGAAANDYAGFSVAIAGDINGDGIDDFIVGARNGDGGGTDAGQAYVIYGKAGATRPTINLASLTASDGFIIRGDAAGDLAGGSVSGAGDVNGDGIGDIIVGAGSGDDGGTDAGEAYVIYGQSGTTRGLVDLTGILASEGFRIQGDAAGDVAGYSVSDAGDVNGDGIGDLIVGATGGDDGGDGAGEAYVIYGKSGSARGTVDLSALSAADGFIIRGDTAGDVTGISVSAAGDINGDGIDDVIVGAHYGDDGGSNAGEAYVIYGQSGSTRGTLDLTGLATADGFVIRGDSASDRAGNSVSNAGDVNGDGIDDLIVGAPYGDDGGSNAGEAYVIYGQSGNTRGLIDLTGVLASEGFKIQGDTAGELTGFSVASAGDINGDGLDDILVGAITADGGATDSGRVYVIFGKSGSTRGTLDLTNLAANEGIIINGVGTVDFVGRSVSGGGDINGDGIDDLIVGAPYADSGGSYSGSAYVIYGSRTFGTPPAVNGSAAGETVTGTADADTLNGFGGNDVLIGGGGEDILNGGDGNDIAVVDSAGDVVVEAVGDGIDSVETSLAAYTLTTNVENLEYTGAGAFNGSGNALGNIVVGGAAGDTLSGLGGDDTLGGEAGDDILDGGNGADRLNGGTGTDTMNGGVGDDVLIVDSAGDIANGGDGSDTVQIATAGLTYSIAADIETVSNTSGGTLTITLNALGNSFGGSNARDTVSAGDGVDILYGRGGNDSLAGEGGNDRIFGDAGIDTINGGEGDDMLYGGGDIDSLSGSTGNDTLYGEAGDDFLQGNGGADQLFGGAGADSFLFFSGSSGTTLATADRIRDFSSAQGDQIDLSLIDAITGSADDGFSFIGSGAFTNVAGQLRAIVSGGQTLLSGDTNGDGVADFLIRIDGVHTLVAGDFVL